MQQEVPLLRFWDSVSTHVTSYPRAKLTLQTIKSTKILTWSQIPEEKSHFDDSVCVLIVMKRSSISDTLCFFVKQLSRSKIIWTQTAHVPFSCSFGRTDLRTGGSWAKFYVESYFPCVLLSLFKKLRKTWKTYFLINLLSDFFLRRWNMKFWESETRFGQVWSQMELSLGKFCIFEYFFCWKMKCRVLFETRVGKVWGR